MDDWVRQGEQSLATSDLDEAREMLTRRYCSHRILQRDRSQALDVRYSHRPLQNISFNHLQYGAEVDIRANEFETFYMVHIPLAGHASIRSGGNDLVIRQGVAAIVSPTHQVSTTWTADCKQLMVKIDRKAVERFLSHLIYRPVNDSLDFAASFDLTTGLGASFVSLVQHFGAQLANNQAVAQSELVSKQIEQTLIMLLLCGVNHSYQDALQATTKSICPKHVVKAYQYMVANAHTPITVEDLTLVAGVSGRALYEGFRRFKGSSPRACLKAIRMERVRRELLEGSDCDDVTMVAQRWGFFHLGRFASDYQSIFGEKPSQTLRRRR
jgi:AraC-like DNA-binding protein